MELLCEIDKCNRRCEKSKIPSEIMYARRAKEYVQKNLGVPITQRSVAQYLSISAEYLCSVFKKDTGKTIMQYLAEQRIDLAKRLILTQQEELHKISELCGFSDYNHFSHTFKKISGMSPMFYRKIKNKK